MLITWPKVSKLIYDVPIKVKMKVKMKLKSHYIFMGDWPGLKLALVPVVGIMLAINFLSPARAQETEIEADNFTINKQTGLSEARGQVRLSINDTVLLTDFLTFDENRNRITLPEAFQWQQIGGEILTADKAVLNQQDDTAKLTNIRIELVPQGSLMAAQAEKKGEQFYLYDAQVTSCKSCASSDTSPLWKIRASQTHYDRAAHYISHKHARFEVAGVPIFYLPYLAHVGPEINKASGFLTPAYYNSNDFGSAVETPYFFNLAPNYDLTITPRFSAKQNPLMQANWRHLTHFGSYELRLWGHEPRHNLATADDDYDFRGGIIGNGDFKFGQWRAQFHLEDSTDDLFLRRYQFITDKVMDSWLSFSRQYKNNSLTLSAYRYRATLGDENATTVDKVAPRIVHHYRLPQTLWKGQLALTNNLVHIVRDKGLDITELNTKLDWKRHIVTPNGLDWKLGNSTEITAQRYHDTKIQPIQTNKKHDAFMANSAFVKAGYPLGRTIGNFSEKLEPQIQLVWATDNEHYQRIPLRSSAKFNLSTASLFNLTSPADEISRINYGMRYQATHKNSFLGEVFVGQSYNLTSRNFLPASGYGDDASAIITEIILGYKKSKLRQNLRIDEASGDILRQQASLSAAFGGINLSLNYRFLQRGQLNDKRHEEFLAGLDLALKNNWAAKINIVQDIENDRRTNGEFILTYEDDCLRTELSITQNRAIYSTVEPETTLRLGFTLLSFTGN